MGQKPLVIAGATAPEIVTLLEAINDDAPTYEIVGFVNDDEARLGQTFCDYPVLGGTGLLADKLRHCLVVNNVAKTAAIRARVFKKLRGIGGAGFPSIIHPRVSVRRATVGDATVIHEGCVIGPGAAIGENCLLSFHVIVAHESIMGDAVLASPGVILNGRVRVEEGAFLGAGCIILPYRSVGAWSMVGAGSVCLEDVPPHVTVFGAPARVIQKKEPVAK